MNLAEPFARIYIVTHVGRSTKFRDELHQKALVWRLSVSSGLLDGHLQCHVKAETSQSLEYFERWMQESYPDTKYEVSRRE